MADGVTPSYARLRRVSAAGAGRDRRRDGRRVVVGATGVWGNRGPRRGGAGFARGGSRACRRHDKAGIKRVDNTGMAYDAQKTETGWDALYGRARLVLDEDGAAAEAKRREVAAKKLRRAGLDAPPVDLGLVKRALVEYARTKRYLPALESAGVGRDDMNLAYDLWPEAKTVYEYVRRMRDEARGQEMEEVADLATDKLKTLLRDDEGKCMVNAKLVMQTLERLDRRRFGEDGSCADGAKGGGDGEPMVYQISNVQMNLIGSDALKTAFPSGGVVDVDSVVKALEGGTDG